MQWNISRPAEALVSWSNGYDFSFTDEHQTLCPEKAPSSILGETILFALFFGPITKNFYQLCFPFFFVENRHVESVDEVAWP